MKTALVTGCSGFVGSHLVKRLHADGYEVSGVDKNIRYDYTNEVRYFRLCDVQTCFKEHLWDELHFDLIFHCAAIVGGRKNIDGSPLAVATNLSIDSEFFHWLSRLKRMPERIIYFSSSAVYPVECQTAGRNLKLSEALVDTAGLVNGHISRLSMPDQTYGWAKLSGEILAQHAVKQGIPVIIYRPFSGYGEGQSLDYPFPSLVKRVLDKEDPVTVWGSGTQVRDFIHIQDVIDGVFETVRQIAPGDALNLGSGFGITFKELASDITVVLYDEYCDIKALGSDTPEGVHTRVADVHKLSRYFTPKVSLEEGIRRVADSLRSAK